DFDGDAIPDIAVGAGFDDDGGNDHGAIWILLLNEDGSVRSQHEINDVTGGFEGNLDEADVFGRSIASLGDLDGDGVTDLAVGSPQDDDGGNDRGAIWILFLHSDATVKSFQKISSTKGGFGKGLADGVWFGIAVTSLGDLDGDGITDIASSALFDDGGAVWILFLNENGTVKGKTKIMGSSFGRTFFFGEAIANVGDVDGDGNVDLGVTDFGDNDGGDEKGALWLLFLTPAGTVSRSQKISAKAGGFTGNLHRLDHLGSAVTSIGDLNGDGTPDIVVGADLDDDGGTNRGALWILFLRPDGTVLDHRRISDSHGGFGGILADEDRFGRSVAAIGDLDGDLVTELAVGAIFEDAGGADRGAVWNLFLEGVPVTTTTLPHACGNGVRESTEECDDGGNAGDDGCSAACQCEPAARGDLAEGCDCFDVCGDPSVPLGTVTAVDAAFILRASVGSEQCSVCVCDLDASAAVTAADALLAVRRSTGLWTVLSCSPAQ
ncbi:MAG TPA: integrin alpha, partial [Candidatus Binatia bacterium]|nr:integrin alpha [Candidatus Binatia bacterium]